MGTQRKRSPYKGRLAEPVTNPPVIGLDPNRPPLWWTARGGNQQEWAGALKDIRHGELTNHFQRILDLVDHFGLDRTRKGWLRDLALCLALRHESKLISARKPHISKVFAAYGIDPDDVEIADLNLVWALATRHVPGFQFQFLEPKPSRLDAVQIARLYLAFGVIHHHYLVETGKNVSIREIVRVMKEDRRLRQIIPGPAADGLSEMIATGGNRSRGTQRPISDTALRNYLRDILTAWSDYKAGKATQFQMQYLFEVIPPLNKDSPPAEA